MLTSTQLATGGLMYTQEEGEAFVDRLVREAANEGAIRALITTNVRHAAPDGAVMFIELFRRVAKALETCTVDERECVETFALTDNECHMLDFLMSANGGDISAAAGRMAQRLFATPDNAKQAMKCAIVCVWILQLARAKGG